MTTDSELNLEEIARPYIYGIIGSFGFKVVKSDQNENLMDLFWADPVLPKEQKKLACATQKICLGKAIGFIIQSVTYGLPIKEVVKSHEWEN